MDTQLQWIKRGSLAILVSMIRAPFCNFGRTIACIRGKIVHQWKDITLVAGFYVGRI